MATTFDVIFLGAGPLIDPSEGSVISDDITSENASALVGNTYGTSGNPLYSNIQTFSPGSTGYGNGEAGYYHSDNYTSFLDDEDTFRINGGADQTFDAVVVYNTTITYADSTTASISAVVFQDTNGNLYLAPEVISGPDQDALEAKAIQSLTFDSLLSDTNDMWSDRVDNSFVTPDGEIDGTSGDDSIGAGYVDAQGDRVDGADGDDDVINSGDGSDTIAAGAGDDTIDGGADDDTIDGGAGHDRIVAGSGNDSVDGGTGDDLLSGKSGGDSLFGASGADILEGEDGADSLDGGEGNDTIIGYNANNAFGGSTDISHDDGASDTLVGGAGNDALYAGIGDDSLAGGDGDDTMLAGGGNDTLSGGAGDDLITTGVGDDLVILQQLGSNDIITDFDIGDTNGDGRSNDQIDVSGLRDLDGNPVNIWDVVVTDNGSGDALLTFPEGETLTFQGISPAQMTGAQLASSGIPCFTAGTMILTPDGERHIEDLCVGDHVTTRNNGPQPIQWISNTALGPAILKTNPELRPVKVATTWSGCKRDLLISPQHSIVVSRRGSSKDVFVRAGQLARLKGGKLRIAQGIRRVSYVHLLLPTHDIVFANGLAVETFYPGPRAIENLKPEALLSLAMCLPMLIVDGCHKAYGPPALCYIKTKDLPARQDVLNPHNVSTDLVGGISVA
ncbi:Hint domain-containing protein [uncultured Pelagimonas sp.]|uniref:Hint domain-containing protein n=1 Tax=uncultured Pelagimonas sp. TaxID=1618102 RepID=UPI002612F27D|nr:Hint domain-containing protein [uncultured Pelagimonas sp.]